MRYPDIKRYLQPYMIVARRKTTINHAFAAAVAPCDDFDESRVRAAVTLLGQEPDSDLLCVYCGQYAETWDHVFAIVQKSQFSGHGHRLGNLLPCCKPCNSKKGNKDWKSFLQNLPITAEVRIQRSADIQRYLDKLLVADPRPEHLPEYQELQSIKQQVLDLLVRADAVAQRLRDKERPSNSTVRDAPQAACPSP